MTFYGPQLSPNRTVILQHIWLGEFNQKGWNDQFMNDTSIKRQEQRRDSPAISPEKTPNSRNVYFGEVGGESG